MNADDCIRCAANNCFIAANTTIYRSALRYKKQKYISRRIFKLSSKTFLLKRKHLNMLSKSEILGHIRQILIFRNIENNNFWVFITPPALIYFGEL